MLAAGGISRVGAQRVEVPEDEQHQSIFGGRKIRADPLLVKHNE
jgi:hypothetical protein